MMLETIEKAITDFSDANDYFKNLIEGNEAEYACAPSHIEEMKKKYDSSARKIRQWERRAKLLPTLKDTVEKCMTRQQLAQKVLHKAREAKKQGKKVGKLQEQYKGTIGPEGEDELAAAHLTIGRLDKAWDELQILLNEYKKGQDEVIHVEKELKGLVREIMAN